MKRLKSLLALLVIVMLFGCNASNEGKKGDDGNNEKVLPIKMYWILTLKFKIFPEYVLHMKT
jgi:hypothetical protein